MRLSTPYLKARKLFYAIVGSISFYPALVTFSFVVLAVIMDMPFFDVADMWILEHAPFITTVDPATTRSLIGAMIGGLLTLTVFSFTMVMVLLNQASAMYSPRLLPGLVSNKKHQIVLGIYLGTLLYSIVILIGIRALDESYNLPHLAIVWVLLFMGLSIVAFVYFIHSISTSIQIDVIINSLYLDVISDPVTYPSYNSNSVLDITGNSSQTVYATKSGYISGWDLDSIATLCTDHQLTISLLADEGDYILMGDTLAIVSQIVTSTVQEVITDSVLIDSKQVNRNAAEQSIQHLLEISMKAMSPGINDPLTAISSIERLTLILSILQRRADYITHHDEGDIRLIKYHKPYRLILQDTMIGLQQYCVQDPLVAKSVSRMLTFLSKQHGAVRGGRNLPSAALAALKGAIPG